MFARVKKSGAYQYLQLVENRRENGKVLQRVLVTLGRLDQMTEKGEVESLIRSLSRFSEKALLILSDKSTLSASALKIGPSLVFERLWKELGIGSIVASLAPTGGVNGGAGTTGSKGAMISPCTSSTAPWPFSAKRLRTNLTELPLLPAA